MTARGARLVVHDGLGHRVVQIDKPRFTIGRQAGRDLQLAASETSRDHAEIVTTDAGVVLHDRGSRYGTFVNGARITEQALQPGDRIECGRNGAVLVFLTGEVTTPEREGAAAAGEFHQVSTLLASLRQMGGERVLDEVLALVLDAAIEATGAERGFIMLADATDQLELKLARGSGKVVLAAGTFATSHRIPDEVFKTGEAAVVADLLDEGLGAVHTGTIALGIRQVLCVPLRLVRYVVRAGAPAQRRNIGVLYLDSRERGRLLSQPVRLALEAVAAEAALAIENARLYQEAVEKARLDQEMAIASRIQRSLLPAARRVGPFFAVVGSAESSRKIGGDFFEYQDLPDGRFGIGIGDITGKGPPAALLAALVQGVVAAEAVTATSPERVIAVVNRVLLARPIESRFVTLFLGTLAADGRLAFCNAGQTPPFWLSAAGVRRLDRGGTLVGAFPDAVYELDEVQLAPDDVIVLVSDGVTEAMDAEGEQFGDERIELAIAPVRTEPPERILDTLLAAVKAFVRDVPQHDDLTAVVLRYGAR